MKYYYSLGLAGYEIWPVEGDSDHLMAQFVGTDKHYPARKYKIQETPGGRAFIRPDNRRIYLDEALCCNIGCRA